MSAGSSHLAAFLVRLPFAGLSFAAFFVLRSVFRVLARIRSVRAMKKPLEFTVLEDKVLDHPLALPLLMTISPRLNPHATIANLGPVRVDEHLQLRFDGGKNDWLLRSTTLYTYPRLKTMSQMHPPNDETCIELNPGWYSITIRYYHCENVEQEFVLPGCTIDGVEKLKPGRVSKQTGFYSRLAARTNFGFAILAYHILFLLRFEAMFSGRMIERLLLPVGSSDTSFRYGYLAPGESIRVEFGDEDLDQSRVYCAFYNRASLPVNWFEVHSGGEHFRPSFSGPAIYLIRIRHRDGRGTVDNLNDLTCVVVPPQDMIAVGGENSS